MKRIIPGYRYQLENFEDKESQGQVIQFIEKKTDGHKLITVKDGTTNEEVLKILIDRLQILSLKLHSVHNDNALRCLLTALSCLELRTEDRRARGVEGTPNW